MIMFGCVCCVCVLLHVDKAGQMIMGQWLFLKPCRERVLLTRGTNGSSPFAQNIWKSIMCNIILEHWFTYTLNYTHTSCQNIDYNLRIQPTQSQSCVNRANNESDQANTKTLH